MIYVCRVDVCLALCSVDKRTAQVYLQIEFIELYCFLSHNLTTCQLDLFTLILISWTEL